MKFTKIITYFLFRLLVFTCSTHICEMAAYSGFQTHIQYRASQLFNSCYSLINKTSLSQTHKPYFKHNKNQITAFYLKTTKDFKF